MRMFSGWQARSRGTCEPKTRRNAFSDSPESRPMRLGLLADIHAHTEYLRKAIACLSRAGVERFIVLGDVIDGARGASETVAMLRDVSAVGVWGNHELGLAVEPNEQIRELFSPEVLAFMAGLSSHYELADLLVSHALPTQDAYDPMEYYLHARATDAAAVMECFRRFGHRIFLTGHLHCWLATTTRGLLPWKGTEPIVLQPDERYLFVVNALKYGCTAYLDTTLNVLVPVEL